MKKHFKNLFLLACVGFAVLLNTSCSDDDDGSSRFVDDRDGKTYETVKIGEQTWMAQNMAYQPSGGDYWSPNGNADNVATYGYLYSWETAQTIAPAGWHLPSDAEWDELVNYLGPNYDGGGQLKEEGTAHWMEPNVGATNASGFTALPAGGRFFDSNPYKYFGEYVYYWTATESVTSFARYYYLYTGDEYIHASSNAMQFGFSVRCIKD